MENIKYNPEYFLTLAKDIMFNHVLYINNSTKYKICDIEFYLYTPDHRDPYTFEIIKSNKDLNLLDMNTIQISDKVYLTLGNNDSYLGILIRGVTDNNGDIIEGNKCIELFNEGEISLERDKECHKNIIKSGVRVLSNSSHDLNFKNKNYRFTTEWSKIKKKLYKYSDPDKNVDINNTVDSNIFIPPLEITDEHEIELLKKIWLIKNKLSSTNLSNKLREHYNKKLLELEKTHENA